MTTAAVVDPRALDAVVTDGWTEVAYRGRPPVMIGPGQPVNRAQAARLYQAYKAGFRRAVRVRQSDPAHPAAARRCTRRRLRQMARRAAVARVVARRRGVRTSGWYSDTLWRVTVWADALARMAALLPVVEVPSLVILPWLPGRHDRPGGRRAIVARFLRSTMIPTRGPDRLMPRGIGHRPGSAVAMT